MRLLQLQGAASRGCVSTTTLHSPAAATMSTLASAITTALCVQAAVAASVTADEAPAQRPNVLMFAVDDLRPQFGKAFGYEEVLTPNLDRFLQEGLVFRNSLERSRTAYRTTQARPASCSLAPASGVAARGRAPTGRRAGRGSITCAR